MQSLKEKASNAAASAKSGMEKTKATVQEKVDRMTAHDPTEKEMATERKQERIHEAEMNKQATQDRNAALHHGAGTGTGRPHYSSTTAGSTGHPTGFSDGVVPSQPIGTTTGTQRPFAGHNTHMGDGANQDLDTGGNWQL